MTLSPESRARALLAELKFVRWPSEAEAVPIIATAIREAEDAALERAAQHYENSESLICQQMADAIRTFKHKD